MTRVNVQVPAVGESITEVTVASLLVKEGAIVKEGDPLIELESDKATVEVPAPVSGKIIFSVKAGETLAIGAKIGEIDTEEKVAAIAAPTPAPTPAQVVEPKLETTKQTSSGPSIRISMDQFLGTLEEKKKEALAPESQEKHKEQTQRKPMSKLRKTIAKRLVQVKNETAMLTTFNEVDMSEVMKIRNREKEAFQKEHGAKLTFLPFFIKAAISALRAYPDVNAYIDGDDIVYNEHQHIGIAVSTPTGLVVPVMRNVDQMSFLQMTKEITVLADKARDRKLSIADMSGGTFTITNGGVFGSMLSTPIINPPQSAILGMHNIVERPVAIDGKVEIRPIMYLALSYDHRIIDGKESVSFLVQMKNMLEEPTSFMLYE